MTLSIGVAMLLGSITGYIIGRLILRRWKEQDARLAKKRDDELLRVLAVAVADAIRVKYALVKISNLSSIRSYATPIKISTPVLDGVAELDPSKSEVIFEEVDVKDDP